jgi:hypothetical protein
MTRRTLRGSDVPAIRGTRRKLQHRTHAVLRHDVPGHAHLPPDHAREHHDYGARAEEYRRRRA